MKIKFQNSIVRLSFLYRVTDIKIVWIYTWLFQKFISEYIDRGSLCDPRAQHKLIIN